MSDSPPDTKTDFLAPTPTPAKGAPRALRLRTLLTVPFVLLIVAPALIIAGTSLYTGLQAVDLLSRQLMEDISARVGQAAVHQLEEAAVTLRATFPGVDDNHSASFDVFTDDERLERKLFELTSGTRTSGYFYFGREDGSFVGVDRGRPGARAAATVRLQAPGSVPRKNYTSRGPGDRSRLLEIESRIYQARERPWYESAKATQRLIWTKVYPSFASGALVTTAAQPVFTKSGALYGVLAADVELSELSTFMKGVAVSANGVAFIVDREGMLVASSTPESPFRIENGVQLRVAARDSQAEMVRAAAQWWRGAARASTSAPVIALINSTGEQVDVASRRVTGIEGIDWDIVVAIPRSDFTAPIVKSAISMFFVILAALAGALMLGLWVLRRVTRDVDQLVAVTRDISADGLPSTLPTTSLAETGVLAHAFGEMVQRLQQSLATIRRQNDKFAALNATLEERVVTRTTQLAEQNVTLTEEILRRERLERELRQTSKAAQKAAEDKARFLAILSHELRTPLQAVVGTTQLLSHASNPIVSTAQVETLDAASKSLLTLIDGVLSYSRLEAGVVTPVLRSFELRACIDEAMRVSAAAQVRPNVTLAVQIDETVPQVIHTDQGMLRQVLINLLGNALKFTQSGEVRIRVGADSATQPGNPVLLRFAITDTGPGIDIDTQQRLFQPFQQGAASDENQAVGSGLGLVICSMLVRALDGEIHMQSKLGQGTSMTFSILAQTLGTGLVVDSVPSSTNTSLTSGVPIATRSLRVMVVEDNDINRELLQIMLEQLGHSVVPVGDGEAAIEAVANQPLDVVLMDLNLPRIGGVEATRQILQNCRDEITAPVIVALTASVSEEDRALCAAAGMRGFLTKPATVFSLDMALRAALAKDASEDEKAVVEDFAPLDRETLDSLSELDARASEPFLRRLIERFLNGLTADVTEIGRHWEANDIRQTKAAAHALAGAASAVGASELAMLARAASEQPSDVNIRDLGVVSGRTRASLRAWMRHIR
ncbi:MAG: response regulator [Burkholderiales bacterium]|nr:response regulator [Burkholderiales bacterium]